MPIWLQSPLVLITDKAHKWIYNETAADSGVFLENPIHSIQLHIKVSDILSDAMTQDCSGERSPEMMNKRLVSLVRYDTYSMILLSSHSLSSSQPAARNGGSPVKPTGRHRPVTRLPCAGWNVPGCQGAWQTWRHQFIY